MATIPNPPPQLRQPYFLVSRLIYLSAIMLAVSCTSAAEQEPVILPGAAPANAAEMEIPPLEAVDLSPGRRLRIVATTSIIGDVTANISGNAAELVVLMEPGQDPHAYEPSARQLAAVARADIILANGLNLELGIIDDLEKVGEGVPILLVSAGITPLESGAGVDPHVWLDPHHVRIWVANILRALKTLDPGNAGQYERNAETYLGRLEDLISYIDAKTMSLPAGQRKLVTNHDAFSYFAGRYGFELVGIVIPASDTLAEPSAAGLSALVEQMKAAGVCTIFTETTASDQLARAVLAELDGCKAVHTRTLYTEALGAPGGEADSYIKMMKANIDAIIAGLEDE